MKRSSRRALLALVAAGLVPLTSGCGLYSETTTERPAQLSNGISAQVGEVGVRDLLVVGSKGSEGLVSGALVNHGSSDATVTVSTEGAAQPVQVPVPAGRLVTLGGQGSGATVVVGDLKVEAGSMMPVQLASPSGGQVQVQVPVLDATDMYASVTPPPN